MSTGAFGQAQPISARQWHAGFLPSRFQGVPFRSKGDAVLYVNNPAGINPRRQRDVIDTVAQLNRIEHAATDDPEILTRIAQYEMAFRMQTSVPELMDVSGEPASVLDLYGAKPGDGSFASNCLLARRLAERGVRFIQLYHRDWDHHGAIKKDIAGTAREVDQACAALITDLKQRGLLDDTLVIWGGEFGRTPMAQGDGRDHHMKAFSMRSFGVAGVKPASLAAPRTRFGLAPSKHRRHVHDLRCHDAPICSASITSGSPTPLPGRGMRRHRRLAAKSSREQSSLGEAIRPWFVVTSLTPRLSPFTAGEADATLRHMATFRSCPFPRSTSACSRLSAGSR
jgi:hypothetical protein